MANPAAELRRVDPTVRAGAGDTLLLQASNDTLADHYGTVITAEALLRGWWAVYPSRTRVPGGLLSYVRRLMGGYSPRP